MKKINFNSGPAVLPQEVLDQASEGILDFNGIGLSILEIGHRTKWFVPVLQEARSLVKELLGLGDEYDVLFLQGGATTQFMQIPMNLLDTDCSAAYCDHGTWGSKAADEASYFGNPVIVASSKDKGYTYIQRQFDIPEKASYLHLTSNNTVEGTQWKSFPDTSIPVIADMSSDIFSRRLDFSRFSLIYAGAQKNSGAAGVTLVIVKKDILGKIKRPIPPIMDYRAHIKADALLNTPPVFSIFVSLLTLRWIKKEGGLEEMEKRAQQRSDLLYGTIDRLPLFETFVNREDRSQMNAVFFIKDKAVEKMFLDALDAEGFLGVKGYRTMGGFRVSMYNAQPLSSVQLFCDFATEFAKKHG